MSETSSLPSDKKEISLLVNISEEESNNLDAICKLMGMEYGEFVSLAIAKMMNDFIDFVESEMTPYDNQEHKKTDD